MYYASTSGQSIGGIVPEFNSEIKDGNLEIMYNFWGTVRIKFTKSVKVTDKTKIIIKLNTTNTSINVSKYLSNILGIDIANRLNENEDCVIDIYAVTLGYQVGDRVDGIDLYLGKSVSGITKIDYIDYVEAENSVSFIQDNLEENQVDNFINADYIDYITQVGLVENDNTKGELFSYSYYKANQNIEFIDEYENANGLKIRTAPASIFYNPDATIPTRVVMQNNGSNISFDLATGEISKPYYSFNPAFNEFTFKTTFAPNKPQDVFDVKFSIETNKGNQYLLRANYVDSLQCWVGKYEFDEYDLPASVGVEYIDISSTPVDPIYAANATALMIVANHETYKSAFESKVTFDESSAHGNDKEASFNLNIDGFDSPFAMKVKELDYAAICAEMDVVQYTYLYNSGDTVVCINADSNEEMLTLRVVDSGLKVAYDITLSIDEAKAKAKTIAAGATVVGATNVFDKLNNFLLIPKYINAYQDYQSMKQMRDNNMQRIDDARNAFLNAIGARCKDGTPMLPDMWATSFYQYAMDLGEGDGKYYDDFENELDEYKTRVWKQAICDVASLIISNGINSFAIGGLVSKLAQGAIIPSLTKMLPRLGTAELVSKFLIENGVSTATNVAAEQVQHFFKTDFQAQKTHINDWSSSQLNEILKEYSNQTSRVKEHYQECPEDPLERPTSPFKKRHRPRDTRPIIDPSGYVYESGNEDKRIEGVTATLYFKAEESSEPTLWDAAEYGQINPLVTDAEGSYSWFVPEGLWQVRFSKEGYADTQTEWLPVPPPQLEVNIPMTRLDGVLLGDANDDKFIDVADITAIAAYILGKPLEVFNKTNADANCDNMIDVADITATAGIILGR